MPGPIDPEGLLEYSVVFTDRSLNHMSAKFQDVMTGVSATLRKVYGADAVALVPGGGTYGMEAVARQLATGRKCLVVRNGWFSYRWSQIFEAGGIPAEERVLKARPVEDAPRPAYAPAPVEDVVAAVEEFRPDLVLAPHVETASGMILPDDYLRKVAEAVRRTDGLFALDCIASGTVWVDMAEIGIDVLISAPQKGWSASPCSALVMLSERARSAVRESRSTSFAADLGRWLQIMEAYENGAHAYHATMPTDAIVRFHAAVREEAGDPVRLGGETPPRNRPAFLVQIDDRRLVGVAAPPLVEQRADRPERQAHFGLTGHVRLFLFGDCRRAVRPGGPAASGARFTLRWSRRAPGRGRSRGWPRRGRRSAACPGRTTRSGRCGNRPVRRTSGARRPPSGCLPG